MQTLEGMKLALVIDRHDLDVELEKQPQLYSDMVELTADLYKRRDLLKEQQKSTYAKLYNAVMAENEKLSDAKAIRLVEAEPEYQQLSRELIDMSSDVAVAQGLLEAFNQRASSLRRLADLMVSGYYTASPSVNKAAEAPRSAPTKVTRRNILRGD